MEEQWQWSSIIFPVNANHMSEAKYRSVLKLSLTHITMITSFTSQENV